jgi:hypothetical protein
MTDVLASCKVSPRFFHEVSYHTYLTCFRYVYFVVSALVSPEKIMYLIEKLIIRRRLILGYVLCPPITYIHQQQYFETKPLKHCHKRQFYTIYLYTEPAYDKIQIKKIIRLIFFFIWTVRL